MQGWIIVIQVEQEIGALIRADIEAVRLSSIAETHHLVRAGDMLRFTCQLRAPDNGAKLGRCEINLLDTKG